MSDPMVLVEGNAAVPVVRLNRPKALGALNGTLLGELDLIVADLAGRSSTRAIVLTPVEPVPAGDLLETAVEIAETVARQGPRAVRSILTAVRAAPETSLENGLALEASLASAAIGGAEGAEGIAAFRARRPPDFPDLGGGTS
ncbi:MAG TPA: hypothetical protein VGH89_33140 [Pseudonocardia sp.]|jgi:enoyl-CoA hydratase/carnithine racemase